MTDPNHDEARERALGALFDRTAGTLSEEDRARLGRRARDVGSFPRRPLRKLGLMWAPALAAASAVAYLAVPMRHVVPSAGAHSAVGSATAAPQSTAPRSTAPQSTAPQSTPSPADDATEADDPAFAVLGGEASDVEPLDLGPLMMATERSDHHHSGVLHEKFLERQSERSGE